LGILFIDLGEVRTFELKGFDTIGRESGNDIVVTHPTVSRQHARIECVNGLYTLTDFNSRNGTRVNGKAIVEAETLIDGARMRIGHVRAWFFESMPTKLPRSISNRDRGIVFQCECGQRLWSASDTAGMTVTCGGCNQSIEVPEESVAGMTGDSAGTVAGVALIEQTQPQQTVCNVCQWPIEKSERAHRCPACGLDFHLDCWRENRGCSAYGCSQVNVLAPKERPATPQLATAQLRRTPAPTAAPAVIHPVDDEAVTAVKPSLAWAHAMLALSVVGSLLGTLTFGVPAAIVGLIAFVRLLISRTDPKTVLAAAVFISLLGAGAGFLISRFWWQGQPLMPF
jgi:hypothetical protein